MGVFREAMRRALALRGLAPRTCSAYLGWLRRAFLLDLTQRQLSFLEPSESSTTKHETRQDTYRRLTGNDPRQCPVCRSGRLVVIAEIPPASVSTTNESPSRAP